MARDGSGNHSLPEAAFVSGTTIESAKVNSNFSDISSALSGSLAKDGQTVPTANLPMGGFKHTNVAVATSRTDYARASQIADNSMGYAASSGTDTITATPAPGISAYAIGQRFTLKKDANANTGAVTLNINSIGAGNVTHPNGDALVAGDLPANCMFEVAVQATTPVFHLLSDSRGNTAPTASAGDNDTSIATTAFVQTALTTAIGKVYVRVFTGSGTYTPTTGMVKCIVECVGGGGGGGGCANTSAGIGAGGGGGGGGSYALKVCTAADIGASKAVTIGAAGTAGTSGNNAGGNGGDTSVGSLCIGKGGTGGGGNAGGGGASASGGAGGIAGTGDVTVVGRTGDDASAFTNGFGYGAAGGSSRFGNGAKATASASVQTGAAATGYGGGGAGGQTYNGNGNVAGGAGTAGLVVITEFCNQ